MIRGGVCLYQMGKIFLLSVFLLSASLTAHAKAPTVSPDKYSFCSITINSDNEIKAFQRRLAGSKFEFHELTKLGDRSNWFQKACESGIRCDVLLISGHYGGSFFGDSGFSLSQNEIDEYSCKENCKNLLGNQIEVFFFGCNTLATKERDGRSDDEYRRVLVEHGMSVADATRVVESRYGAVGQSSRDRMRWAFADAKHLYGFQGKAPLGADIEKPLLNYLDSVGDYARHLEKIETEKNLAILNQLNSNLSKNMSFTPNTKLEDSLSAFPNLRQCAGVSSDSPDFEFRTKICSLHDDKNSIESRLDTIASLMRSNELLAYIPTIDHFFRKNSPTTYNDSQKNIYESLNRITKNKDAVLKLVDTMKSPILAVDLVTFSHHVGWLTGATYRDKIKKVIKGVLRPEMNYEDRDVICSMQDVQPDFKYEDFPLEFYQKGDGYFLDALACLRPTDAKIIDVYLTQLKKSIYSHDADRLMTNLKSFFQNSQNIPAQVLGTLADIALDKSKNETTRKDALDTLGSFAPFHPPALSTLSRIAAQSSGSTRAQAIYAVASRAPYHSNFQSTIDDFLKYIYDPDPMVRTAVIRLQTKNVTSLLKNKTYTMVLPMINDPSADVRNAIIDLSMKLDGNDKNFDKILAGNWGLQDRFANAFNKAGLDPYTQSQIARLFSDSVMNKSILSPRLITTLERCLLLDSKDDPNLALTINCLSALQNHYTLTHAPDALVNQVVTLTKSKDEQVANKAYSFLGKSAFSPSKAQMEKRGKTLISCAQDKHNPNANYCGEYLLDIPILDEYAYGFLRQCIKAGKVPSRLDCARALNRSPNLISKGSIEIWNTLRLTGKEGENDFLLGQLMNWIEEDGKKTGNYFLPEALIKKMFTELGDLKYADGNMILYKLMSSHFWTPRNQILLLQNAHKLSKRMREDLELHYSGDEPIDPAVKKLVLKKFSELNDSLK